MFDGLKGIRKERDVKERAESTLEKLLEIEEQVRKEYAGKLSNDWPKDHDNIYLSLYKSLSSTLPDYTDQDIQSLLLAKANNKYNDNEAQVLGMYTGVLLHVLTKRLEKKGKKARFTFDLHRNELDYLFLFARRVGEVTVKKVKGTGTCANLAAYGGTAEKLVLEGNEGDWAASNVGSNNGKVGTLAINGNKGHNTAFGVGYNGGNVGIVALYNAGKNLEIGIQAKRIIKGREALALYKKLDKELP